MMSLHYYLVLPNDNNNGLRWGEPLCGGMQIIMEPNHYLALGWNNENNGLGSGGAFLWWDEK